jgi:HPt (histidine-containing phosphotransfer) domain-containing protein
MNDFVTKPINPQELIAVLCHWMKKDEPVAIPPSIPADKLDFDDLPGFDLRQLRDVVDDDHVLIGRLLLDFRDGLVNTLADIDACLARQDFYGAHALTHGVKGMAGSMGAISLFEATTVLDDVFRAGKMDAEAYDGFCQALQQTRDVLAGLR